MKKNLKLFTISAACILSLAGLASCDGKGGEGGGGTERPTENYNGTLVVSGSASQLAFYNEVFDMYNTKRTEASQPTINFEFRDIGEDKIDSSIADWTTGPDVYAFASDKIMPLFQQGAMATIPSYIVEANHASIEDNADQYTSFAGREVGYPYCNDNGYFLYYDKSQLTEQDVATFEGLMDKADSLNETVIYPLEEAFYSAGVLGTFGAKWTLDINETNGALNSITADYDGEKGIKAGKALIKMMGEAHLSTATGQQAAPTGTICATVNGSWSYADYKASLGDNLGVAKLPTITVDGETQNLFGFLGYKLYGVNPQASSGNNERLLAAHYFAEYLISEEVQELRFDMLGILPTNTNAMALDKIKNHDVYKAISAQKPYTVAQTAVPANIWSAPVTLVTGIKNKDVTEANIEQAMKTLNDNIEASK